MREKDKIKDTLEFISSVKGIKKLKLLNKQEKEEILKYEGEAEKRCLMGLMPGVNQGVREAISRTYTVAALTTDEFEWPERGTVKFVYRGVVIGEDVRDKRELEKLKSKGNQIIGGVICMYKDRIIETNFKFENFKDCTLLLAPLDLPWTERIPHATNVVVGSPSIPTDLYIKKILNAEKEEAGSILIGFEII